ncbi:MAG: type VI secretion system protein TssA [Pirellulales bacterium]
MVSAAKVMRQGFAADSGEGQVRMGATAAFNRGAGSLGMASQHVLDVEGLLAPIAGDSPCGVDLKWDPVYDLIKAARQQVDRGMIEADQPVTANWPLVVELTGEALAGRSKDLMLAGWLTEALVHLDGFSGLTDGLKLIDGLLDRYWEEVYPRVEDGDLEARVAPLAWLTEADRGAKLPNNLRESPLAPGEDEGQPYSWVYWKSRYVTKGEKEDEEAFARRKEQADVRSRRFEEAVAATPLAYYVELRRTMQECSQELAQLDRKLDERFGKAAPGTTAFKQALADCEALVRRILKDKGGAEMDSTDTSGEEQAQGSNGEPRRIGGPIGSRDEAFRRLAEVAAYLRRTEPQSPVPLLIDRAVSWGQMPFEQLLMELIKDSSLRSQVGEVLGLRRDEG